MTKRKHNKVDRHAAALRSIDQVHAAVPAMDRACTRSLKTITLPQMDPLSLKLGQVTRHTERCITPLLSAVENQAMVLLDEAKRNVVEMWAQWPQSKENSSEDDSQS